MNSSSRRAQQDGEKRLMKRMACLEKKLKD